jgi:hypothetical protein
VTGVDPILLGDFDVLFLFRTVLGPVGDDEPEQGVIGEARASDVAAKQVGLLGGGVNRVDVGPSDDTLR